MASPGGVTGGLAEARCRPGSGPQTRRSSRPPPEPAWRGRPGLIGASVNASRLGNRTGLDSVVMTAGNQRSGRLRARCDVCDEELIPGTT